MTSRIGIVNEIQALSGTILRIGEIQACNIRPLINMMTRHSIVSLLLICLLQVAYHAAAKPMDVEAGDHLQTFKAIVAKVKAKQALSREEEKMLDFAVGSNDPVLMSLTAWCLPRLQNNIPGLYDKLLKVLPGQKGMSEALIILLKEKNGFKTKPAAEQALVLRQMLKNENEYLRAESAKELAALDPSAAKRDLKSLLIDPSPIVKSQVVKVLQRLDPSAVQEDLRYPIIDERYAIFLSIIDGEEGS